MLRSSITALNEQLNLLATCKQVYNEARPIAFATQPAYLDLWSGSWDLLMHTRRSDGVSKGSMLGSTRTPEKVSHDMPVEDIKRLLIRHFNWKKGSAAQFLPIDRRTFQRLRPEEIYLHGYYCGKTLTPRGGDRYNNFLAAVPFLAKLFSGTDHFIADLRMDKCWFGYGFETFVAWHYYSQKFVSDGLGDGWELAKKEMLERAGVGGVELAYTGTRDDGDGGVAVGTVTFTMRFVVVDGYDGCMEDVEP